MAAGKKRLLFRVSVVEAAPRCVWDSWRRWEVLSMIVSVFGSVLCSTTSSRVASCEPATAPALVYLFVLFFYESLGIPCLHGCVPAHDDSPSQRWLAEHLEHPLASTEGAEPPQRRLRLVFHAGWPLQHDVFRCHIFIRHVAGVSWHWIHSEAHWGEAFAPLSMRKEKTNKHSLHGRCQKFQSCRGNNRSCCSKSVINLKHEKRKWETHQNASHMVVLQGHLDVNQVSN